ncbi:Protein CBG16489 [Caenorhabditis briggsae]|uniref:Protein CBG16489 n=1 Tax=Caenorhabditis briggsae TaxID=6238 RepID=A8XPB8_CAEBR|nr:Protein CBG16489 [Caenorhabditis briggsae]CAP34439.2 Protein CBG16489 [Caenorhabditis briggsae]
MIISEMIMTLDSKFNTRTKASVVCIHLISVGAHLSQGKVKKFYYQLERNISELSRKAITKARNDGRVSRRFLGRKYTAFSHDNTSRTIRRFVSARDSSPINQNSVLARRSMSLSPIPFSPSPECSVDLSKNTTGLLLDLSAAMNVSSDSKSNANVTQED